MRYPIGRISKLLGLSTETIRTYERKGIVHPQKNENGYRTFHVLDIGTLLRCRSYSCFGLSLSEAADAINCNSVAETHALLVKQEKWLKKQTDYNLRMLNRLNDLNEVMSTCEREINRLSVVQHPACSAWIIATTTSCFPATRGKSCWRCGRPLRLFPSSA